MTLQDKSKAKTDSLLLRRFSAHLVDISNDIRTELDTVPNHYLRVLTINVCLRSNRSCDLIANQMRLRALAEDSLTLPIADDNGVPEPQQTAPTDTEIINAVNSYMADAKFLSEILYVISA